MIMWNLQRMSNAAHLAKLANIQHRQNLMGNRGINEIKKVQTQMRMISQITDENKLEKINKKAYNFDRNCWEKYNTWGPVSDDGLSTFHCTDECHVNVMARWGFPISGERCRKNNFSSTIVYYFEVTQTSTSQLKKLQEGPEFYIGLSHGLYKRDRREKICEFHAHSYAFLPGCNLCHFAYKNGITYFARYVETEIYPKDAIFDEWREDKGNVAGCGLLLDSDNKVSIFFTENGTLMGQQMPISPSVEIFSSAKVNELVPTVRLCTPVSLEANFGDDPAKPFKYDLDKCPGLVFKSIK